MWNARNTIRVTGTLTLLVYLQILGFSPGFASDVHAVYSPILQVLLLFAAAFGAYVITARCIFSSAAVSNWREVFLWGLVFRAVMWPSLPIQEVDFCRYVWDGAVSYKGIDPYQFSPSQVIAAAQYPTSVIRDSDLRHLVREYQQREGLRQIANRVHYGSLTTPYPPVSQAVFAFAHVFCPQDASEWTFTLTFKAIILLFDAATAIALMAILRFLGYSQSLVVLYWWCPLVIKEFANSGHLDSIAVFFVVASFYFLLKACFRPKATDAKPREAMLANDNATLTLVYSIASAGLLACGVGAKLFPLVLAPLWAVTLFRRNKYECLLPIVVFAITTVTVCWPMFAKTQFAQQHLAQQDATARSKSQSSIDTPEVTSVNPSGIEAFYRYWEINDLVFLFVVENLKPASQVADQPTAWFVVTSESWRATNHKIWQKRLGIDKDEEVAFVLTRRLLAGIFCIAVAGICVFVFRNPTQENILTAVFLTLAWLWFLSPTQNPWYWTWAIPFLPFMRNRAWIAVSGLALIYYLRFWFKAHFVYTTVLSTAYKGLLFFDFIMPWVEFGPWLLVLILMWLRNQKIRSEKSVRAEAGGTTT